MVEKLPLPAKTCALPYAKMTLEHCNNLHLIMYNVWNVAFRQTYGPGEQMVRWMEDRCKCVWKRVCKYECVFLVDQCEKHEEYACLAKRVVFFIVREYFSFFSSMATGVEHKWFEIFCYILSWTLTFFLKMKKYIYPQFSKSLKSSSKITTLTNTTYLSSPERRQKSKKNDTEDEPFTSFHKFRPRSVFS